MHRGVQDDFYYCVETRNYILGTWNEYFPGLGTITRTIIGLWLYRMGAVKHLRSSYSKHVWCLSEYFLGNWWQRNWVFAPNSDFLITISLEPIIADIRYFKLWILLDQIIWVWNIKGLQHRVLKILRFKCFILFQRLNSFSKRYTFATWIWWCEPFIFDLTEFMFDTSQFYEIGLQRYMNKKIRVCGKDSILL